MMFKITPCIWNVAVDFLTPPSLVTTNFPELLTMFAAALGCGLLIGLERERSKKMHNIITLRESVPSVFARC